MSPEFIESVARQALKLAERAGDKVALASAHQELWRVESSRRSHEIALDHLDHAVDAVRGAPELREEHLALLGARMATLHDLDRLDEASRSLETAQQVEMHRATSGQMHLPAAIHYYWRGQWDDALSELSSKGAQSRPSVLGGTNQPDTIFQNQGLAALIMCQRGDAHFIDGETARPFSADPGHHESEYSLVARSVRAEQQGEPRLALEILSCVLNRGPANTVPLCHWLPLLTRLALATGKNEQAQTALRVAAEAAGVEAAPARAWAAMTWCRGLLEHDPECLLEVARHHRRVSRLPELASVLEDAAVLLAEVGHVAQSRQCYAEATEIYLNLGAKWCVKHAEARLAPYEIDTTAPNLDDSVSTATSNSDMIELRISELVAAGLSNSEIAASLAMPRRMAQVHISHALQKYNRRPQVDVAPRRLATNPAERPPDATR
jgi:tetratricopeptide (TPR) repeat protein